jgi:hypothetical protein
VTFTQRFGEAARNFSERGRSVGAGAAAGAWRDRKGRARAEGNQRFCSGAALGVVAWKLRRRTRPLLPSEPSERPLKLTFNAAASLISS